MSGSSDGQATATDDLVVAMRSGPPFNHEHADRNGMILKCFGERLVVDPMRPPYARLDSSWKMRLTPGHSAALVDGQGHQYVSGVDGTNASEAVATIIRHGTRDGYMFWTSDATPAFQLVLPDVESITRTMITLTRIPAVIVIDKLIKKIDPLDVAGTLLCIQHRREGEREHGRGRVHHYTPDSGIARAGDCGNGRDGAFCIARDPRRTCEDLSVHRGLHRPPAEGIVPRVGAGTGAGHGARDGYDRDGR